MKKQSRKLSTMLEFLLIGIVPLVCIAVIIMMVAGAKVKSQITDSVHSQLEIANIQLNDYVSRNLVDELPTLYENDNKDYSHIDSLLDDGIVMTVFYNDTRAISSVKDDNGKRAEGTKASDAVIVSCLKGGNHYTADDTIINGSTYFVDYLPIKDSDGKIVGMSFTGMKSEVVNTTIKNTILGMLSFGVLFTLLFIGIIVFIGFKTKKVIETIVLSINNVAQGDISTSIENNSVVKENQDIIDGIDDMRTKLSSIIGDVQKNTNVISSDVSSVNDMTQNSSNSIEQVTLAIEELANGTTSMASDVQDVNIQVGVMSDRVDGISGNTNALLDKSSSMKEISLSAQEQMASVKNSSNDMSLIVEKVAEQIDNTNNAIKRITEAVELINNIAGQTKLLSLNASIEAARAGDAGRGFSVVASSIGELASQSNVGAETIRKIAEEIQINSETSVELAKEIKNQILVEQEKIDNANEEFSQLIGKIDDSIAAIETVNSDTNTLKEVKMQILDRVTNLSAISEENAASCEEVSASMSTISADIDNIAHNVDSINNEVSNLNNTITFFK